MTLQELRIVESALALDVTRILSEYSREYDVLTRICREELEFFCSRRRLRAIPTRGESEYRAELRAAILKHTKGVNDIAYTALVGLVFTGRLKRFYTELLQDYGVTQ